MSRKIRQPEWNIRILACAVQILAIPAIGLGIVLASCHASSAENTVEIKVSTNEVKWRISDYLLGMHFVYAHEQDSIYADGRIAEWARKANVGVARFPGGTVVKF